MHLIFGFFPSLAVLNVESCHAACLDAALGHRNDFLLKRWATFLPGHRAWVSEQIPQLLLIEKAAIGPLENHG